ncbi:MAG TPA: hypothetical protein VGR16_11520 [Thermomicrobiales bacterium]|nr:hypothetical protein [Thermomicrobiales bacterium]
MNEPSKHISRASHPDDSDQEPVSSRIYDSFIVRLWRVEDSTTLLRAEIEHVQTGLFLEELHVPLDWILAAIASYLQPPLPLPTEDTGGDQI